MAKAAKKSKPSKRANKYQEKVKVNGSFDDLMGALFPKPPAEKPPQKSSTSAKKVKNKK